MDCSESEWSLLGYPLHSPLSPSLLLPCVAVCHQIPFPLYCTGRKLFRHLPTCKIPPAKTEDVIPTEVQAPLDCFLTTEVRQTLLSGVPLGNYNISLHGKRILAIFQLWGLYVRLSKVCCMCHNFNRCFNCAKRSGKCVPAIVTLRNSIIPFMSFTWFSGEESDYFSTQH